MRKPQPQILYNGTVWSNWQSHVLASNINQKWRLVGAFPTRNGAIFLAFLLPKAKWNDLHWPTSCDSKGLPGALKVLIKKWGVYPKIPQKKALRTLRHCVFLGSNPPRTTGPVFVTRPRTPTSTDPPSDQRWTQPPPTVEPQSVRSCSRPSCSPHRQPLTWHVGAHLPGKVLPNWCHGTVG